MFFQSSLLFYIKPFGEVIFHHDSKTMNKKQLRILYISQYFPPEVGATQTRAFEMVSHFVKNGHHVTVLTEFPNHPRGLIHPEYKGRWFKVDRHHDIDILRTWVFTRPQKTFFTRLGFYLSFMIMGGLLGTFIRGPFDVVYATSPPFFVGLTGLWLSRIKNAKFVFEVRDLWPQTAVELGEITNERFIRWSEWLESLYYRKSYRIVTVTKGLFDAIVNKGYDKQKIRLIPNGTNTELFYNRGKDVKSQMGFDGKFVVLYAGIFGIAQGMEQLCDLVVTMKSEEDIHFLFIGEGPMKQKVLEIQNTGSLSNMSVLPEVQTQKIADYISSADCCLVPLKKSPLFLRALPSKLFDYMACERPVVVGVDGEARRVVEESKAGIFVEPGNTMQMAQAILKLKAEPDLCLQMGRAGRAYVKAHFSRRQQAFELEKVLEEIV